jgi:hypothetical protein
MRILGIVLLALGIVLLIPCGIALLYSKGLGQMVGFLLCTALLPLPMIIGGIAIIRRVEDSHVMNMRRDAESPVAELPSGPKQGEPAAPSQKLELRNLDLTRLNWVGWLLLFGTFGFVVGEAGIMVLVSEAGGWWADPWPRRGVGLVGLLLAVGFFVAVKWLLRLFGVSIYRW